MPQRYGSSVKAEIRNLKVKQSEMRLQYEVI